MHVPGKAREWEQGNSFNTAERPLGKTSPKNLPGRIQVPKRMGTGLLQFGVVFFFQVEMEKVFAFFFFF